MAPKKNTTGKKDMSNNEMFKLLMGEMVLLRREVGGKLDDLRTELTGKMTLLKKELILETTDLHRRLVKVEEKVTTLGSEFRSFRLQVHNNQLSFMEKHDKLEDRVVVLEGASSAAK